jgi:toxin FitB
MAHSIYLADTNVISELIKKSPNEQVLQWLQSVELIAISAVTIEEAHFGLAWQPNAGKLHLFNAVVQSLHTVYPITESIAHQLIVATRNVRDFLGCGVQVVNPFDNP